MLNNDLSNKSAPILAFNFERVICEEFSLARFRPNYKLHKQRINAINKLYWSYFSIYYITFKYPDRKIDKLEDKLEEEGCLFNGILKVKDLDSLLFWFKQQVYVWYFDIDIGIINAVHPFGQLWQDYFIQVWNKE